MRKIKIKAQASAPAPARAETLARYPAPTRGVVRAPAGAEEHARAYVAARARETIASREKEAAGAELVAVIRDAEGISGDGWCATWLPTEGRVNWEAAFLDLARRAGIGEADLARYLAPYRGASTRTLRVTGAP